MSDKLYIVEYSIIDLNVNKIKWFDLFECTTFQAALKYILDIVSQSILFDRDFPVSLETFSNRRIWIGHTINNTIYVFQIKEK